MIDIEKWIESARVSLDELEKEVKRLRKKLFEAELWVNNDSYTFENDMKELMAASAIMENKKDVIE